jgi:UDP-N-acetylglucosamine--N-acetylmuramyl-(pentapeptide) pyrophosphoryl-undecaprenol N-acetylglucosamine transferase
MRLVNPAPLVAIACGGTGGHLFPGLAVAEALRGCGAECHLFVSMKEVDRQALGPWGQGGGSVETLPAVGWDRRQPWGFVGGFRRAWRQVRVVFGHRRPDAVVAMGGFTGVAPVLAGLRLGVPVFLHESNAIPGRANRWLAPWVRAAFVGFPQAAARLRAKELRVCGTPVRTGIGPATPAVCREALGLAPDRTTVLIMGGSQGARAINRLTAGALERWRAEDLDLQFLHLTGRQDEAELRIVYARHGFRARVTAFTAEMGLVLGAADVAVGRAGASSLAELAAARLPAILIPFPAAADNHQVYNARAYADTGAAWVCEQGSITPSILAEQVSGLIRRPEERARISAALAPWHRPDAAREMAEVILEATASGLRVKADAPMSRSARSLGGSSCGERHFWRSLAPSGHGQGGGDE